MEDFPFLCFSDKRAPILLDQHAQDCWFYCTLSQQTVLGEKIPLNLHPKAEMDALLCQQMQYVSCGLHFQASHAIFFPSPKNPDVVSQPVKLWKTGNDKDLSLPSKTVQIELICK